MSLIYPEDAFARFGPAPLAVHDANGRRFDHVIACDPLTGEVIQHLPVGHWMSPLLIATEQAMEQIGAWLLRRHGVLRPRATMAERHWFAPAPLTITRVEAP
jgi:hypothetical protein